jgi:uncharacterized membrane protein
MDEHYDWTGLYHDPDDPRLFVPKRNPSLGWTVNVEHPYGRTVLGLIVMVPFVGLLMGALIAAHYRH